MTSSESKKEYYQRILRQYENEDLITVDEIEETPACETGGSFVSAVTRVNISGYKIYNQKREGYQKNLIVKQLPSAQQSEIFRSNIAMRNEEISYNKIIPTLQSHSAVHLPFATCMLADKDVIILEDLSLDRFVSVERSNAGLSLQQCEIVLDGLAKLHAASFVFKHKNPDEFGELTKLTKELLYEGGDSKLLDHQKQAITNVIELFSKLPVTGENQKALEVLQDIRDHSQSKIKELLQNPRKYSVICHGDPWIGNIMFNEQNELKLLDLQLMRYNSVATDLCYLLYINLPADVRVKNMKQLLHQYLISLHEYIKRNDVDLTEVLTEEWLRKEMETFAVFGVVYGIWIMPVFFAKKKDIEITQERLSDASKIGKQGGPECEKRIKELVLEYVRCLS